MNGYNFTDRVRKILQMAREESARFHHEYVGTEHILLALVREGEGIAVAVLTNLNVDPEELRATIQGMLKEGKNLTQSQDLPYTSRAKKILEFAMTEARDLGHSYVGTEHLLLGVLREEKGLAAQGLLTVGVTLEMARAETLRLLGADERLLAARQMSSLGPIDQRFKTAIALIELHRVRFGSYPDTLAALQFLGPYDTASLQAVRYEKLPDGYALDIVTPKGEKPGLSYPADFWRGLGIRRTNVDRSSP